MKVADIKALPPKILMYGPAGSGKTAFAMTLGKYLKLYDIDGNIEVGYGLKDNLREDRMEVEIEQFLEEGSQTATVLSNLKQALRRDAQAAKQGKFPYKVVALDSLTALAAAAERSVMKASGKVGKNPEIQHWGMLLNEIRNVVDELKAFPLPTIIIAHEMETFRDDETIIRVNLPGKTLPGNVLRMFSEIWYMRVKQVGQGKSDITIQTAPTSAITARSGRGLSNGLRIATIDPKAKEITESVSLLEVMKQLQWSPENDVT